MKKIKVLLVDDSPLPLAIGKDILESGGYDVVTAGNGLEALQLLSHNSVAVVITDILMPEMDGYSLCRKIRSSKSNDRVRIVVYSATYVSPDDEKAAIDFGADMVIAKPASLEVFLAAVKNVISQTKRKRRSVSPLFELTEETRQYNSRLIEKLERNHQELQLAQRELRKSEARFRALIENNFEAISLRDENGTIIYQSPATERLTGFKPDETNGRPVSDFIHPDDIADVLRRTDEAMSNPGKPVHGTTRILRKDGVYIWTEGTTTNLLHDENVRAIVGNFRDVTDHKLANERISENQKRLDAERERFADLFLQAPSCICILAGKDHVYEMANPLYLEITGKKDIIGKTAREVFPELVDQGFLALLDNVYRGGTSVSGKEQFIQIDQDGTGALSDHYMDFLYQPYKDHDGVIEGIFFFANLVTEEVTARKKIEQHEKYYRALVENAAELIVVTDKNGKLTYVSPALEKLTGRSAGGSEMPIFSMQHPQEESESKDLFTELLGNPGVPISQSSRLRCKDGSYKWVEGTVCNLLDDENVRGIVGNFRDVTERRRHEENLIKANRLYAFISQINQTIVHAENEQAVFREACRIAIQFGQFKMAWIGIIDRGNKTISLTESGNIPQGDIPLFINAGYDHDGALAHILAAGTSYVCNDLESKTCLPAWKQYAVAHGVRSLMVLPIMKAGAIIGTFNLYASEKDWFDEQEIALLEEAASDISFAVGVFEKEKHRKQLEKKITHSELRLQQAQAIAHFGSWELNFSTGIALWSDEACSIYGLLPEEHIQSYASWVSYIHPDDLEYVTKVMKESQRTLSSSAFHHRIVRKDGSVRYIYSQAQFEFDKWGKPTGLTGVAHDETEMKEAEKSLAQSEGNLRLIMDLIPQKIFAKDAAGKFVFTNKSFAALYGVEPKDLINKIAWNNVSVKNELEGFKEEDEEVISSGRSVTIDEQKFTDYKGNKLLFHTVKVPFTVTGTDEPAVLGITTDITQQKQAEDERTKIISDIIHRNNDLEQFSYIVSHNLRAPVANILGLVNIMQTIGFDKAEETKVTAFLATAAKNLDTVIHDINNILALKDNLNENRELVIFEVLLEEVRLSIINVIQDENATIIGDFSGVEEMMTIKSYLYSIFYNLISNSIKYRQQGVRPIITISTAKIDDKIHLCIKDNSLGIDLKKNGGQVFKLYKRFHAHVEGKGMGLFMVKTQVELLGGKISIASEINKGSEFTIEFDE